ncbi:MAG: NADH-quinone oxidoreductase subunit A [Treponema sp.]|nr:NADH-quinone oxidoreductase subunit A [Treponema sp.]
MLTGFLPFLVFMAGGFLFSLIVIATNWLFRPHHAGRMDERTYECGLDTEGPTWIQFKIAYYLYALVFVVFDVETIFLFPWALTFKSAGMGSFIEMIAFIAILVLGIWYAWRKGAFEWK